MNTFGQFFRISIYGESHGAAVGIIIDGVPAGIPIVPEDFQQDLARRKAGKKGTTTRVEDDNPVILSGVFNNYTTGAPINLVFENRNVRSEDYEKVKDMPRPGHADFVAHKKFRGFNDYRGGGHFSGRLTLPLVAAGVIAKKLISPVEVKAVLSEAGGIENIDFAVEEAIREKDSIGGIITCNISHVPVGIGEPFFNSVESVISHLVFSIPAVKGIEFGSGFASSRMKGSEHNDWIIDKEGHTTSNYAGGINGGISNGNEIYFKVAIKPTSSISKSQQNLNIETGELEFFQIEGRHDVCIALRAPVVIEAVTSIAMADLMLQNGI
jgi:chorismate synthase